MDRKTYNALQQIMRFVTRVETTGVNYTDIQQVLGWLEEIEKNVEPDELPTLQ